MVYCSQTAFVDVVTVHRTVFVKPICELRDIGLRVLLLLDFIMQ